MKKTSRRTFLSQSALSLASASAGMSATTFPSMICMPNTLQSHAVEPSPNNRLQIGVIGVDGQGRYNWGELLRTASDIVALCDVDETRAGAARGQFPKAKFFSDYRKLLEMKQLDAVLIATPDHHHAPAASRALQSGLHVYCEKPLTHSVAESRHLAELARSKKRVTQMGTQIHAGNNYRRVVEVIRQQVIGKVKEVHVWVGKSWGGTGKRPTEKVEIPKTLSWDTWLGPAKERPFNPTYVGGGDWRRWWDFGGGTLADMACHFCDLPFWALDLKYPTKISARGPSLNPEMAATWMEVEYDFPDLKFFWYDGGKKPALLNDKKVPINWGDGVIFVGEKGMLAANYGTYKLFPEDKFKDFKAPPQSIPNSIGHHKEWVEACKSGGQTTCNFTYSGRLTETVLLGVVAFRTGKTLEWDATKLKVTNVPEAEELIKGYHRKGWELV